MMDASESSGFLLSRRKALLSAIALFPLARAARSQDASATFSSDVNVVTVLATVTDRDGRIVQDLSKADFSLEEDGRPQTIRYFSRQTEQPLTLGLLVDTSGSERRMIGSEKEASHTFLEQVLRPDKDRAFLIHFDREVELLQDVSSSRDLLEKALEELGRPEWGRGSSGQPADPGINSGGPGGGHRRGGGLHGGTALYDAVYLATDDLMKKQTGRKALVLLTDGEDNGSKVSLEEAIAAARRSETLVYSVRIADDELRLPGGMFGGPGMGRHGGGMGRRGGYPGRPPGNRQDGKKVLQQMSRETGGGYFEVSKKKSVDEIYKEIEDELRNQYSLGYTPDRADGGGQYRRIELSVRTRRGLNVQAREGYYAKTNSSTM